MRLVDDGTGEVLLLKNQQDKQATPIDRAAMFDERKYTEKDMLFAFKHGVDFEQAGQIGSEMNSETPDINLPFWEWLKRHYT